MEQKSNNTSYSLSFSRSWRSLNKLYTFGRESSDLVENIDLAIVIFWCKLLHSSWQFCYRWINYIRCVVFLRLN